MKHSVVTLIVYVFVLCLSGCVTVTDNPKRKFDKSQILESNIKLGMAYLDKDLRDNALRAFTKALEVDKKSAEAHLGMALIHQVNGEWEMAEKRFQKALKLRADFSMASIEYSYARFLSEKKQYGEALVYFEKASQDLNYRGRTNALFNVGLCLEELGRETQAIASYQHALNINKKYAPAALELAHKSFSVGEYAEAKRYLDTFTQYARRSARSLWLGIRIERIFQNKDKEASYGLALRNLHPYSREFLSYKKLLAAEKEASK